MLQFLKFFLSFIFIFHIFFSNALYAQEGAIRGFVYDKESGEPIIYTNVTLKNEGRGSSTDENGYYSITELNPGTYTLHVTYIGYDTATAKVTLEEDEIINKKLYISENNVQMEGVTVKSEKKEEQTEVKTGVEKISPKQIEKLPSVGGEADIAQYMQVIPGVVFTGDQGGQLYIRGGSPVQNKVLLDGMVIYNPFHSIGLFSVFDTDIIQNANIYTGGFNAQFGGRISSVMDITTKDGNYNEYKGKLQTSTFGAKARIEGPISKPDTVGESGSSFILTTKSSYLEQSSKALYTGIDGIDSTGLPFNYTDIYGKMTFKGENGSKFNLFGFNYNDHVSKDALTELEWNTFGGGADFVLVPRNSSVLIDGNFSLSQYDISLKEKGEDDKLNERNNVVDNFNLGFDFKYFKGEDELKYGINILGNSTELSTFNSIGRKLTKSQNNTELSSYLIYKEIWRGFVIEPSLHLHYYASLSEVSPEPRLRIKYNAAPKLRFKLATGVYTQNLISVTSDRDVVNLFTGFITAPKDLPDSYVNKKGNTKKINSPLQRANHYIFGVEYDITRKLNLNVEGYFKNFTQLTNRNRNKLFNDSPKNSDIPDILKKDFIVETGKAKGVDMTLKYSTSNVYLWLVYSLQDVDRWDGAQEFQYDPVFDRRHNINLVATYKFGKNNSWEANARWNFGSGFPFTRTQGVYEKLTFKNGISTDITKQNGNLGLVFEKINQGRLPDYHRLDINVKKKIELKNQTQLKASIGVTNLYNRNNIFFFDRVKFDRVNQLPILPNIGLSWEF